jgi:hypothetical protein
MTAYIAICRRLARILHGYRVYGIYAFYGRGMESRALWTVWVHAIHNFQSKKVGALHFIASYTLIGVLILDVRKQNQVRAFGCVL